MNVQNLNFAAASQTQWNSTRLPTAFISNTEHRASVSADLAINRGTAEITVINLDGRTSSSFAVEIGSSISISPRDALSGPATPREIGPGSPSS